MSIKDCREGVESITVVGNMGDGTMKTNQNGVLKIAENEAAGSINGNNIKRSRKLKEKGLQNKLEQLKTKKEKINTELLRKSGMVNDMLIYIHFQIYINLQMHLRLQRRWSSSKTC